MRLAGTAAIALALALGACGGADSNTNDPPASSATPPGAAGSGDGTSGSEPELKAAECPLAVSGCVSASGTIVYVERVDPDGDGDAHFVLLSREGVTAPGITVVDVRTDLRPHPLPAPGDRLAAAGPVFRGSYGQRQIQAEVVNVAR